MILCVCVCVSQKRFRHKKTQVFKAELARLRRDFIGGPTPLYFAKRLTDFCGGAQTLEPNRS